MKCWVVLVLVVVAGLASEVPEARRSLPEAQPVSLEAKPVSLEAQRSLPEAQPVSLEAQSSLPEAQPVSLEAQPVSLEAQRSLPEAHPVLAQQSSVLQLSQHSPLSPHGFYQSIINLLQYVRNHPHVFDCLMDTWTVLNASREGLDDGMWALKMLDASSKMPSGILEGNVIDLGQFDECVYTGYKNIAGQHCLATYNIHVRNSTGLLLSELDGTVALRISYCVPDKCSPELLRLVLQSTTTELTHLLNLDDVSVNTVLRDSDCNTAEPAPFDLLDLVVIWLLTIAFMVSLAATVVDCCSSRSQEPREVQQHKVSLVKAFSMYRNCQNLLDAAEDHMNFIDGIRFLSVVWMLFGHKILLLLYPGTPSVNYITTLKGVEKWQNMVYVQSLLSVDTFFIMSGLLNAFGMCTRSEKISSFTISNAIQLDIHRYIRLTPAYLVMILATATIQYHTGNGPLWDQTVLPRVQNCRKYWWANLVYLNNYLISSEHQCMSQSWYLSADMQLFVISPLVVLPLWKWPKFGYCLLATLTAVCLAVTFCTAYFYKIVTTIPAHLQLERINRELDLLLTPTHLKIGSYLTGILLGYLLYRITVKKDLTLNISKVTAGTLWVAAGVCMSYAVFGAHFLYVPTRQSLTQTSLFIASHNFLWSAGTAWLILACSQGYGGIVHEFLSLKIFRPLARLTYCIYLSHVFVFMINIGGIKQANHISILKIVTGVFGDFFIILAAAVFLHLVIESPTLMLEKMILNTSPQTKGGDASYKRKNSEESAETVVMTLDVPVINTTPQ